MKLKKPFVESASMQSMIRWTIFSLAALSMIFSLIGLSGCQFMFIDDFGYGFFRAGAYDSDKKLGCLSYSETFAKSNLQNHPFRAGRCFAIVTAMIAILAFLILFLLQLFVHIPSSALTLKRQLWKIVQYCFGVACFTQVLTFSVMKTDACANAGELCRVGPGGALAAINVWLLIALVMLSCIVPPPTNPFFLRWDASSANNTIDKAWDDTTSTKNTPKKSPYVISQSGVEVGLDDLPMNPSSSSDNRSNPNSTRNGEFKILRIAKSSGLGSFGNSSKSGSAATAPKSSTATRSTSSGVDQVSVTTEYAPEGKKTIRQVTHPDGSKTITTTIEDLEAEDYRNKEVTLDEVDV